MSGPLELATSLFMKGRQIPLASMRSTSSTMLRNTSRRIGGHSLRSSDVVIGLEIFWGESEGVMAWPHKNLGIPPCGIFPRRSKLCSSISNPKRVLGCEHQILEATIDDCSAFVLVEYQLLIHRVPRSVGPSSSRSLLHESIHTFVSTESGLPNFSRIASQ